MKIFKDFPVKELLLRLLAITILISSFKAIVTNADNKHNITDKKTTLILASKQRRDDVLVAKEILSLVERLNAHIEEQSFLLTTIDSDKQSLDSDKQSLETFILDVENSLKEITKEAEQKNVNALINWPQIEELQNVLEVYKQTFKKSKI